MPTIKPRDLVRLPSGDTGHCREILPHGEREVQLLNGATLTIKTHLLLLVRSAPPLPWPDLQAALKSGKRL